MINQFRTDFIRKFHLFFFLTIGFTCYSQVVIENPDLNLLYVGYPNRLRIHVDGVSSDALRVWSDSSCRVVDSLDHYFVFCTRRGEVKLIVGDSSGKIIEKRKFRVRSIPFPEVHLGTLSSGKHSAMAIRAQPGIYAGLGSYIPEKYPWHVDSAFVEFKTNEMSILCKQRGSALHKTIRHQLNGEIQEIQIFEPWLSNKGLNLSGWGEPAYIQSKDAIEGLKVYGRLYDTLPALNQCFIAHFDSVIYGDSINQHRIVVNGVMGEVDYQFYHYLNNKAIESLVNGVFQTWSSTGEQLSKGKVSEIPDSISWIEIEGQAIKRPVPIASKFPELTFSLPQAVFPIDDWRFYYTNGKLKAQGSYAKPELASETDYLGNHLIYYLKVQRTGIWKFYDEEGNLVEEVHYD